MCRALLVVLLAAAPAAAQPADPTKLTLDRVFDDRVEIVVRDQGSGFDLHNLPHAAIPDDPFSHLDVRDKLGLRAGGFGMLICQGMVDEMRYNREGNEVTLLKRYTQTDLPPSGDE